MKADKTNVILSKMISLLKKSEYQTTERISKSLNISNSTTRRYLKLLENELEKSDAGMIISTPGKGVHLDITNEKSLNELFFNYDSDKVNTGESQIYRYLMILLSSTNNRTTITALSNEVYDSAPVVKKNVEACETWLKMFNIRLSIKRNVGIVVIGSEENIRLAIKHIVISNTYMSADESIKFFARGINLELLKNCIYKMEALWNFHFTNESFNALLLYAALAVTRSAFTKIDLSEEEKKTVKKYNEYQWAKSLFEMVDEAFGIHIDENEIMYFSIQLLCSSTLYSTPAIGYGESAYTYDEKLKEFVSTIIKAVSNVVDVDLNKDSDLYYGLLNHIRPAVFRMRFERHQTKNLTDFIKDEYQTTYRVSWIISVLFEKYYGLTISSTELSYITLYIQAALERATRPVSVLLVTELGMGLNQLMYQKIQENIKTAEKIDIMSLRDFKQPSADKYDIIFTTSPLNIKSKKIIQASLLLNNEGISEVKDEILELTRRKANTYELFDVSCHCFFDPKLIFLKVKFKTKEDLIKYSCEKLENLGYVSSEYFGSVLAREAATSTYIGNGVAIPHGNLKYSNESKIVIILLDEPLLWDDTNKADTIFLLNFKINTKEDAKTVQDFYRSFVKLIEGDLINGFKHKSESEIYLELIR